MKIYTNPFKRITQLEQELAYQNKLYWEQHRVLNQVLEHLGLEIHHVIEHQEVRLKQNLFQAPKNDPARGTAL